MDLWDDSSELPAIWEAQFEKQHARGNGRVWVRTGGCWTALMCSSRESKEYQRCLVMTSFVMNTFQPTRNHLCSSNLVVMSFVDRKKRGAASGNKNQGWTKKTGGRGKERRGVLDSKTPGNQETSENGQNWWDEQSQEDTSHSKVWCKKVETRRTV